MLPASRQRILESLADDAVVLDLGGWASPFPRADWVIDLLPYETRGLYGPEDRGEERFDAASWIQRDLCDPEPFPFADDAIDFVVCSHTLEDVRDPVAVCREIVRVGKAGYVEVPSRLEEQAHGFQGPWTGWSHHRWLIDPVEGGLQFVFKHAVVHGTEAFRFPESFQERLQPVDRVVQLWWTGSFGFGERVFIEPAELEAYLADFVAEGLLAHPEGAGPGLPDRARRIARRVRGG
jgi:SAM-dependent methyltransferase